jgi:hypothetical protein
VPALILRLSCVAVVWHTTGPSSLFGCSSLCFVAPSLVDCLSSVASVDPPFDIRGYVLVDSLYVEIAIALDASIVVRLLCVLAICLAARDVFEDRFVERAGR